MFSDSSKLPENIEIKRKYEEDKMIRKVRGELTSEQILSFIYPPVPPKPLREQVLELLTSYNAMKTNEAKGFVYNSKDREVLNADLVEMSIQVKSVIEAHQKLATDLQKAMDVKSEKKKKEIPLPKTAESKPSTAFQTLQKTWVFTKIMLFVLAVLFVGALLYHHFCTEEDVQMFDGIINVFKLWISASLFTTISGKRTMVTAFVTMLFGLFGMFLF